MELTGGRGADVVITATAANVTQEQAIPMAARNGRISFFGGLPKTNPFITCDSNVVHYRQLNIHGANGSAPEHNKRALEYISTGQVPVKDLITEHIPLDRVLDAFRSSRTARRSRSPWSPEPDGARMASTCTRTSGSRPSPSWSPSARPPLGAGPDPGYGVTTETVRRDLSVLSARGAAAGARWRRTCLRGRCPRARPRRPRPREHRREGPHRGGRRRPAAAQRRLGPDRCRGPPPPGCAGTWRGGS